MGMRKWAASCSEVSAQDNRVNAEKNNKIQEFAVLAK
jgi:hypothetical protein